MATLEQVIIQAEQATRTARAHALLQSVQTLVEAGCDPDFIGEEVARLYTEGEAATRRQLDEIKRQFREDFAPRLIHYR